MGVGVHPGNIRVGGSGVLASMQAVLQRRTGESYFIFKRGKGPRISLQAI